MTTAVASILIDPEKDNMILVDPGANHQISFEEFREEFECYLSDLEDFNFTLNVLVQIELKKEDIFSFLMYFKEVERRYNNLDLKVFGDVNFPEIFIEKRLDSIFSMINPNEIEWEDMLHGIKTSRSEINQNLPLLILKQGEKGAGILHHPLSYPVSSHFSMVKSIPSIPEYKEKVKNLNIVDPTGAGDTFFAYLVGEIIRKRIDINAKDLNENNLENLKRAILLGNCAGFLACTKLGACVPPSIDEINNILT